MNSPIQSLKREREFYLTELKEIQKLKLQLEIKKQKHKKSLQLILDLIGAFKE